ERLARAAQRVGCDAGDLVSRCVVGVDVDPDALERCDAALRVLGATTTRLRRADALFEGPAALGGEAFDVVVGNPPCLNQLERATAASRETAARVRAWSGDLVKGYADAAAAFWLLSVRALREGGRCAMVLPRSILSTRDAAGVRA